MNVASKELCQELYAASAWYDTDHLWHIPAWKQDEVTHYDFNAAYVIVGDHNIVEKSYFPAYDLGYLLRKVGSGGGVVADSETYTARRPAQYGVFPVGYKDPLGGRIGWTADTPEDAMCKMIIDLIRVGIITPNQRERE
jgi:hypothetical protein